MSGQGWGGGTDGEPDRAVDCASLFIRTTLNSPVAEVIETLNEGDLLHIQRSSPTQPRLLAMTEDGRTAGSVISGRQVDLLACMEQGFVFVARVLKREGGACDVEIRPEAA